MKISPILSQCDAVILAGGQASRMGGCNKLLQSFDGVQRQLDKLVTAFKPQVQQLWINSHRDHEIYAAFDAELKVFEDIQSGFQGPMLGMLSAWLYSRQEWILFIPCDLYWIPPQLLQQLAKTVTEQSTPVCYARINGQDLYPLCLMHRDMQPQLIDAIETGERSLYRCFQKAQACQVDFNAAHIHVHSVNRWSDLKMQVSETWNASCNL